MGSSVASWPFAGLPPLDPKVVNKYATIFKTGFRCNENEGVDCTKPENLTFDAPRDIFFYANNAATITFVRDYLTIVEAHRKELVRTELSKVKAPVAKFDLNELPENERAVVEELLRASYYLHLAYFKQLGAERFRNALSMQAINGDPESYHFFSFYQGINCLLTQDPYCTALSFLSDEPDRKQYLDYYPKDMTPERCDELKNIPGGDSHYTAIRGEFGGKLEAIPFSDAYGEYIRPAVAHLRNAASIASFDPALKTYLERQADALVSKEPHPVFEADQAWLAIGKGRIFVRFAADETYPDKQCRNKAHYRMILGVFDRSVEAKMTELAGHVDRAEAEAEKLIAETEREINPKNPRKDIYKARKITGEPLKFVKIIALSGFGEISFGTLGGLTLPNWGGKDGKASAETVTFAFTYGGDPTAPFYGEIAESIFTKDTVKHFNPAGLNEDSIIHEFLGHFTGPHFSHPAILDGKQVTRGDTFKDPGGEGTGGTIEEIKAIFATLHMPISLATWGYKASQTPEEAALYALTYSARHLKRPPKSSDYSKASAIQFGWMIEKGVLEFDESERKYRIHFDKFYKEARELRKKLLHIYATNDSKRLNDLIAYYTEGEGLTRINLPRLQALSAHVPIYAARTQPIR